MDTLRFSNGDQMPVIGLGTWKSSPGDVYQAVKEALRIGYRHIDCALIYENEAEIGKALNESFQEGIVTRDQIWVTSKLWNNAHAPEDVAPALDKTLADLKLDYLDLYLIHWPVAIRKEILFPRSGRDLIGLDALPLADTWAAMETWVDKGRCRHIGVSNFSMAKLEDLSRKARIKPEMNQIELHPYLQQPAMLEFCQKNHIHLTGYSPLGSGDRPAALKAKDEPVLLQDPIVTKIAAQHGITPAQVVIRWAVQRGTAVIPKSVNPTRIAQNLAAADVSLTPEDLQAMSKMDVNRRYVSGSFWTAKGSPYTLANLWDA